MEDCLELLGLGLEDVRSVPACSGKSEGSGQTKKPPARSVSDKPVEETFDIDDLFGLNSSSTSSSSTSRHNAKIAQRRSSKQSNQRDRRRGDSKGQQSGDSKKLPDTSDLSVAEFLAAARKKVDQAHSTSRKGHRKRDRRRTEVDESVSVSSSSSSKAKSSRDAIEEMLKSELDALSQEGSTSGSQSSSNSQSPSKHKRKPSSTSSASSDTSPSKRRKFSRGANPSSSTGRSSVSSTFRDIEAQLASSRAHASESASSPLVSSDSSLRRSSKKAASSRSTGKKHGRKFLRRIREDKDGFSDSRRRIEASLREALEKKQDGEKSRPNISDPAHDVPLVLSPEHRVPATINTRLREYQREGVRWLYECYRSGKGGVLGDDMGLGKTIQIIAFASAFLARHEEPGDVSSSESKSRSKPHRLLPVLVVGPSSVMAQWKSEFEAWLDDTRVVICHGAAKQDAWDDISSGHALVLVTSYETMGTQLEEIGEHKWSFVVFDEVHRLKNPSGKSTIACRQLPIALRIGLTGTIIQNKLDELWSVLNVCAPGGLISRRAFKNYFSDPIHEGSRLDAPMWKVHLKNTRSDELNKLFKKFVLRRDKSIIADQLPTKKDHIVFCELTDTQIDVYQRVLDSPEFQLVIHLLEKCECGSGKGRGMCCYRTVDNPVLAPFMQSHANLYPCPMCPRCLILPCMTILQKIANHLDLLKVDRKDSPEIQERNRAFAQMAFDKKTAREVFQEGKFLGMSSTESCGKMRTLKTLLRVWYRKRSKVLLFSYSTRMLTILQAFLVSEGYTWCRLDGATPAKQRPVVVNEFNSSPDKFVFLISTKAGGVGLNLTSADVVVIFDPNWNPSHDLQAQDRSFRIGQRKDVNVYRLFSSGSLEENIYMRQVDKQQLAQTGYNASRERRFFKGSDLFGINNIFAFDPKRRMTNDVIQREKDMQSLYRMEEYKLDASQFASNASKALFDATEAGKGATAAVAGDEYELGNLIKDIDLMTYPAEADDVKAGPGDSSPPSSSQQRRTSKSSKEQTSRQTTSRSLSLSPIRSSRSRSRSSSLVAATSSSSTTRPTSDLSSSRADRGMSTSIFDSPRKQKQQGPDGQTSSPAMHRSNPRDRLSDTYNPISPSQNQPMSVLLKRSGVVAAHLNTTLLGPSDAEARIAEQATRLFAGAEDLLMNAGSSKPQGRPPSARNNATSRKKRKSNPSGLPSDDFHGSPSRAKKSSRANSFYEPLNLS